MPDDHVSCGDALAALEAQLTGERAHDLKTMMEACEAHRDAPWAREFARAVGRLVVSRDLMSVEEKKGFETALRTEMARLQEKHRSALESLERGDLDQAEQMAHELLQAAETFGQGDADTIYADVNDALELEFLRATGTNGDRVRPAPVPHTPALILLAEIQFRRGDGQGALDHLQRAVERNPAATLPRFLRCNFLKQLGRVAEARQEGLQAHALCWLPQDLGQAYRNLAWCESEMERYETGAALALLSLHHDFRSLGLDELRYAQNAGDLDLPTFLPLTVSTVAAAGLPTGPAPLWSRLASALSHRLEQEDEADEAARYAEVAVSSSEPVDLSLLLARLEEVHFLDAAAAATSSQDAWLQRLQASIGGFGSGSAPDETEAFIQCLPPELARDTAAFVKGVPKNRPPMDDLVRQLGAAVLDASRAAGLKLASDVSFGELPLMDIDAVAVKTPQGGHVVGLTSGLMVLCHSLTKIVTSYIPFTEDGDDIQFSVEWTEIEKRLQQERTGTESIVKLLRSAARGVTPPLQPFPAGPAWELAGLLRGAAELFALAVPLVGACLEPPLPRVLETVKLGEHVMVERLLCEGTPRHEAEVLGLRLALMASSQEGADLALSLAGIELFLTALQVLEDMGMPAERGCSARFRRSLVRTVFKRIAPPEACDGAIDLSDKIQQIFGVLVEAGAESLGLGGASSDDS